ncbi:MAG TPA: patatin-like phospholipase family protein, partial [Gaiellaceae bacterium]|nr:patatin-like phospholipase family protein [Gaiellaceae bacterium]
MSERDLAIVLSGGGMNGLLLELGFLRRLREDPLWSRVGWVYGTSAGALSKAMAALDELDALERFVLSLTPGEAFRLNRLRQPRGRRDRRLLLRPADPSRLGGEPRASPSPARAVPGRAARAWPSSARFAPRRGVRS